MLKLYHGMYSASPRTSVNNYDIIKVKCARIHWDPYQEHLIYDIEKIQRHAARWVLSDYNSYGKIRYVEPPWMAHSTREETC